ncbi:MAG: (2Fe-2S) ferredoxin domain-containing protein [Spirulinaceae cyanobacterium]
MQFFVCQHLTCKRQGAAAVLSACQENAIDASVMACGCLGRCGEGPCVLALPEAEDGEVHTAIAPELVPKMLRAYRQRRAWRRPWQPLGLLASLTPTKFLLAMAIILGAGAIAFLAW